MDVLHEMDAQPPLARGVDAMRALNSINDRLARSLLALHCDCGTGTGTCDGGSSGDLVARRLTWGCETIELIADHFGIDYPVARRKIG
ncbi:MAG: hypothetical protein JWN68_2860 [Nocardioides sp.]|jgi:hypothetical protein|uniref:hypothetical protein n=1 Tax=Nocardioides sp. TaxID=35761 RepID=UPI00261201DA|nr:hypothetical protein [Nocardioides sp.]MCW2834907.1 hypothetical protein [Nocardioides sp.]